MLKAANSMIDISTKCGEVFYCLPSVFEILCNECGKRISFAKFLEHFRQEHLVNNETIISLEPIESSSSLKKEEGKDVASGGGVGGGGEREVNDNANGAEDDSDFEFMEEKNESYQGEFYGRKRSTYKDSADDSDSSSCFEFNEDDFIENEEELMLEDDQEYIDSIEQIGFDGNTAVADKVSVPATDGSFDNFGDDENADDLPLGDSDEGAFEYVLFEEEIQPNSVVEEYDPQNDSKDEDEQAQNLENGSAERKGKSPIASTDLVAKSSKEPADAAGESGATKTTHRFECNVCHHVCQSQFNLKYHMEHVHGPKVRRFQCKHCTKSVASSFELIVHKRKFHPELYIQPQKQSEDGEDLDRRPIPCPLCYRRFRNGSSLSTHMRVHNTDSNENESEENSMTCNVCGKVARSPRFYYIHMMRMHGSTFCDICQTSFDTPAEAYQHKSLHKSEKKFKCEYCDTACFSSRGLERHMATHTELTFEQRIKSFQHRYVPKKNVEVTACVCEICGLTLRNMTLLKAHIQRHKNERPFSCDTCGKSFYNRGTLKSHQTIHSNERPFFCNVCGATFQYKRALKTHMILHSDQRDFKCEFCDKAYVEAARLRYHVRLKHGCSLTDTLPEPKKRKSSSTNGPPSRRSAKKTSNKSEDEELEVATKALEELVSQSD